MCKRSDPATLKRIEEQVNDEKFETFPTKIVIARRGQCSFVNKVRNAERAGASLLVVVDTRVENVTNVIMGDDGTGTGIRIPSMLIGKTDGEMLIEFAQKRLGATLSAEFAVKEKSKEAEVEIWYSSGNQLALDFIKEFDRFAHKLKGHVNITPRFVTWPCPMCSPEFKEEECVSNGKYCAPNHIKDDFHRVSGISILEEDLRQKCLHIQLKEKNHEPKWWDYMKEVHSECFGYISEECSKNAHKKLHLDYEKTMKCVDESFLGDEKNSADNLIMREAAEAWKQYGTLYWPSITINQMTFRGDFTAENVLEDICANLSIKPKVCINFYKREHINYEETNVQGDDSVSAEILILVVCVLIGVNVLLILAYRKCVKKEMDDTMGFKVSNAVSQYISVAQTTRNNAGGGMNTSIEME